MGSLTYGSCPLWRKSITIPHPRGELPSAKGAYFSVISKFFVLSH